MLPPARCFTSLLALTFVSFLCPVLSSCVDPALNTTCRWYPDCLEAAHPCGSDGYALAYGQHYCLAFASANASSLLSPEGQLWRDTTLLCLQQQLVPLLNVTVSCKVMLLSRMSFLKRNGTNGTQDLRSYAFNSHARCYVESGVCALSLRDWNAIRLIVCGHTVTCEGQAWQGYFWKQLAEVAASCV